MAIYQINRTEKNPYRITAHSSLCNKAYAEACLDRYIEDEIRKSDDNKYHKYFRLYTKRPHNIEQALAYDVFCPECGHSMKPIGRMISATELYLYGCPKCSR